MLEINHTKFAKKNRETLFPSKQARLINDGTAVLVFAVAVILATMLFTYSPMDSGWFRISDSLVIHNKFGVLGSYTSDIIFSVFGKSGWWLVVGAFYLGYRKIIRSHLGTSSWYSFLQVITFILLITSSSVFEYLSFYYKLSPNLHNGYGGMLGHALFPYLLVHFGQFYTALLTLALVIACFFFTFSVSLLNFAEKCGLVIEFTYLSLKKLFNPEKNYIKTAPPVVEEHDFDNIKDIFKEFDGQQSTVLEATNVDIPKKENTSILKKMTKLKIEESDLDLIPDEPNFTPPTSQKIFASGLPNTGLLNSPTKQLEAISNETLEFVSMSIENKLSEFGVEAKIINAESGPVITRYELLPSRGVRGDKIVGLAKEIARGLALTNVRIVETIPGKNSMGIEVPNFKRQVIYLKEIFDSPIYQHSSSKLTLALGKDISGEVVVTDLAKMPHLLVAGTTGSGKSVAVNAMILSILFQATPDEVKFIMIDPKMVELSFYQDIPHLLAPVVTDMTQAANALKWTVAEMENRYKIMARVGCKNIISLNQKISDHLKSGNPLSNPLSLTPEDPEDLVKWPYIVVIIDELADLMMVTGKKIEQYIARIAQKARAVGIHLIVATQRPSVDVITGLIKANIPARISFQVSSKIDSRTILDQMGAETLLGQGDMLFLQPGTGFPQRIHGAFVNDDELNKVVNFLRATGTPEYLPEVLTGVVDGVDISGFEDDTSDTEKDAIFDEVVKFIYDSKRCSISSLQTRFGIGYNRAARIMLHLERICMVKRNDRGGYELIKNEI